MAIPFLFAEDLTDDVISQSVLFCKAPDALHIAGTNRALLAIVAVTAHRLYATLFGSSTLPSGLQGRRPRLLSLLDRARSPDPDSVRSTFSWAASQGLCTFLSRVVGSWPQADVASLIDHRGSDSSTALCRAAKKQREEAVAMLLQLRADPDLAGKGGLTPLFWAARCGHPGIVQRLLECGASPIKTSKRGDCPLGAALGSGGMTPGKVEALRQVAEHLDASQRSCAAAVRALHDACAAGEAYIVEVLVEFGIGLTMPIPGVNASTFEVPETQNHQPPPLPPSNAPSTGGGLFGGAIAVAAPITQRQSHRPGGHRPRSGRSRGSIPGTTMPGGHSSSALPTFRNDADCQESTPLLAAVGKGFSDVALVLLERHVQSSAYINASLPSGKTALHLAAERGDAEICTKLLEAGASIGVATCSGRSALFAAVEHGHVEAVRALCEKAEVWHLTQQTPSGVSPLTLAERRGKPSLMLPLLRCYHRHVRKRFLHRQPGEVVTDITDPYLTLLCLKFKDQLFRHPGNGGEPINEVSLVKGRSGEPMSQTSRLARQTAVEGESSTVSEHVVNGGGRASAQSSSSAPNRYTRVMEQTRIGSNGLVEGRGRLRSQLDLPQEPAEKATRPRPQSARSGGVAQPRRHSETPSSGGGTSAMRKPWGSGAPSRRQRPASASTQRSGSRKVVARTSSGDLWQRASSVPLQQASEEAHTVRGGLSGTIVAGPIGAALRPQAVAEGGWCQGTCASMPPNIRFVDDREEAAMEADDAMAELLAGYLSDEDSLVVADSEHIVDSREDIQHRDESIAKETMYLPSFAASHRLSVACDSAMYSDDSGDDEEHNLGANSVPAAYFKAQAV